MKICPAHFFAMMSWFLRVLIPTFVISLLASTAWLDATPTGFLEGHLKIISSQEVQLADATPSKMTAENYPDYPLVILSRDKQTEVAHVTADETWKISDRSTSRRLRSGCAKTAGAGTSARRRNRSQ